MTDESKVTIALAVAFATVVGTIGSCTLATNVTRARAISEAAKQDTSTARLAICALETQAAIAACTVAQLPPR
jgi:hypothetical protein